MPSRASDTPGPSTPRGSNKAAENCESSSASQAPSETIRSGTTRQLRKDLRKMIAVSSEARKNTAEHNPMHVSQLIQQQKELYEQVTAPTEAVLDSRVLINASEIGANMARALKIEGGFEIDDYLKRCVSVLGGTIHSRNSRVVDLDDDDEDLEAETEGWNWEALGRKAAKRTKRAPTLDFLLGPLAVEDKKRNVGKRKPMERNGPVVKPQQLNEEDIIKSENETTKLVREINDRLQEVGGEEGINFFNFVIDPTSFSNTVENIFYLSFLVRDGRVSIEDDENGDPKLMGVEQPSEEDYQQGLTKQQLVMEFDMATWKQLIEAYDIREATIPSRAVQTNGDTWTR